MSLFGPHIIGGRLARQLTFSFLLLTTIAVGMAVLSVWVVEFTDNILSQVTTRIETALLSAQIRSESLVLTDLVRRYTTLPGDDADLRVEIAHQQKRLDILLQAAIRSTNANDVDESIAISQVRQSLFAFNSQANRVLQAFKDEGGLGSKTAIELIVLTENYQNPLLQAIRKFEQYEMSQVQAARIHARRVVQTTVGILTAILVLILTMALFMTRHVINRVVTPLTNLHIGVQAIRRRILTSPVSVTRDDEIGRIGEALNTMSLELSQYQQHLEDLVDARTAELATANQSLSREIMEREHIEQALRRSEEQFRQIFEVNPFPLAITRRTDSAILMSNQALAAFLETSMDHLQGASALEFYSKNSFKLFGEKQSVIRKQN